VPWLEVIVEVDAAQAEALSEALMEQGAHSVWIEEPERPRNRVHALLAQDADAAKLLGAAAVQAAIPPPAFSLRAVADQDWVRETQAQFAPICIESRLWIVPSWHQPPARGTVVRLDPGMAFGTGSHASTRLVLGWLARTLAKGASVLDYGCGSGILAIAAAKLGAGCVDAVDVDPLALAATKDNARANGVELRALPPGELLPGDYDVVVANILSQPLIVLEPLLAARTRRGGRIALAGILAAQSAEVVMAYAADFEAGVSASGEGWDLVEGLRR
jgi:ribosomal protein L11 methyltransferase